MSCLFFIAIVTRTVKVAVATFDCFFNYSSGRFLLDFPKAKAYRSDFATAGKLNRFLSDDFLSSVMC